MKFKITESQLKKLMTQLDNKQEVAEDETAGEGGVDTNPDAAPKSGESTDTGKQTGAAKWPSHGQQPAEGPSNVRGNTKWASKNQQPARGAANDIAEQGLAGNASTGQANGGHTYGDGYDHTPAPPEYYEYTYSQYPDKYEVPTNAKVDLWQPSDDRKKYFGWEYIRDTQQYDTWYISTTDPKTPLVYFQAPSNEYLTKLFPDGTIKRITTPDGKVYVCEISHEIPMISSTHGPIYSWYQLSKFFTSTPQLWHVVQLNEFGGSLVYDSTKYVTKRGLFGEDVKFWDTGWGLAVQLLATVAIGIATAGVGTLVEASIASVMLADAAIQAGFNVYVGWQQKAAGNDFGATCSFMFALIPFMGKMSAGTKLANVSGYLTKKEIEEVIEITGMASAKTAEEMGEKFALTIKELEQSAGIARPGAGGVLKNSLRLSKDEAKRMLMNIKKVLTLQPNELVNGSQKFFKVVTEEMGKKGVSLGKISVPFMKRAAIKEIRNITLAQLVAAQVKHDIIQKLYKLFVLHENTFTEKEAKDLIDQAKKKGPEAVRELMDQLGGKEKLQSAFVNTNQTPEEAEDLAKEWEEYSKTDEFKNLVIKMPSIETDSTQNNQAPQQKQENGSQNQPPKQ
jgi:hypothetical protein